MKKSNLKIIMILLSILVITLISFLGIFVKKYNKMENIIPDYRLSLELEGSRFIELTPNLSTKEVEDKTKTAQEGEETPTVQVPVNNPEVLTTENYIISKNILEDRIKSLQADYYNIKLNEENGKVIIELLEDEQADYITRTLLNVGKLTIIDAETEEVLMDNNDLKDCKAMYASTQTGTAVYLKFVFNKESKTKLEEISKKYIQTTDEEGNTITKNVSILIDDTSLAKTYFGETIANGELSITIQGNIKDNETLQEYIKEASILSNIISNGKMPVEYTIETIEYIKSNITAEAIAICICVAIGIVVLILIYTIINYKELGIIITISFIGFISTFLLIIRLTNVPITVLGLLGIALITILNYVFNVIILNNIIKNSNKDNIKEANVKIGFKNATIKYALVLIPFMIISIISCFINWITIESIGMVCFWGLILLFGYNMLITRSMLVNGINYITKYNGKLIKITGIENKTITKIFAILSCLIIISGIIVAEYKGFNRSIRYAESEKIKVNIATDVNIKEIREIVNEVFKNKEAIIQKVELFNDTVSVILPDITEEEKQAFVQKINEKYKLDYTTEYLEINTIPNADLSKSLMPYITTFGITSLLSIVYLTIKYKKIGILKVILKSTLIMILVPITYINLISITRLPINILTIPFGVIIQLITIILVTTYFESKTHKE